VAPLGFASFLLARLPLLLTVELMGFHRSQTRFVLGYISNSTDGQATLWRKTVLSDARGCD